MIRDDLPSVCRLPDSLAHKGSQQSLTKTISRSVVALIDASAGFSVSFLRFLDFVRKWNRATSMNATKYRPILRSRHPFGKSSQVAVDLQVSNAEKIIPTARKTDSSVTRIHPRVMAGEGRPPTTLLRGTQEKTWVAGLRRP